MDHASQSGDNHLSGERAENSLQLKRRIAARADERSNEELDCKQRKDPIKDQLRRRWPSKEQSQ